MDLLVVVVRTLFFYFYILVIYRIMGKREIGQLSIQDLVVSILIAELVAISIENIEDPLILTVIPILLLVILEIISAFVTVKSNKVRNLIEGKPALIIDKGKINFKELIKQRYTLDDLLLELRTQGIKSLLDVEYAVLENSGKLSVFKYNFLRLDTAMPFPLILDGIIQSDTLKYLGKSKGWLEEKIRNENTNIKNVFYAFYKNNKVYIIKRNDLVLK